MYIHKIISGGQSGVDRSALDFSLKFKIECGGWCPRGRIAEDGIIPKKYPLIETNESAPIYRTMKNIESSDGTLIIFRELMDRGTQQTLDYASQIQAPVLPIDLSKPKSLKDVQHWMIKYQIKTLNIAGPREHSSPGIYKETYKFLIKIKHLF